MHVLDIDNGNRLETYVIKGGRGTGEVILNGAAARLVQKGDLVIILGYASVPEEEARARIPSLVFVDDDENRVLRVGPMSEEPAGAAF